MAESESRSTHTKSECLKGQVSSTQTLHADVPQSSQRSFVKLQDGCNKIVQKVTKETRVFGYLKEHFRPVYEADRQNFIAIYKSMMEQLRNSIKENIDAQLEENEVENKLDDLDKIKETGVSEFAWRPSSQPDIDIQAHKQDIVKNEVEQLQQTLQSLENDNKKLNECVAQSEQEVTRLASQIETDCKKWEQAASVITEQGAGSLAKIALS